MLTVLDMATEQDTMRMIQEDHDVLVKLAEVVGLLTKNDTDKEKRIRLLERVVFMAGGGAAVAYFVLKVVLKQG